MIARRLAWAPHVYSIELRKLLSYRLDFWTQFLGALFVELLVAYCLWKAIFAQVGTDRIAGYGLGAMMLYYLVVSILDRINRGPEWPGMISREIYEGGLTRYMVFPVPFLGFKYLTLLAYLSICLVQLAAGVLAFALLIGLPAEIHITPLSALQFLGAILLANYLYFVMSAIFEMVAFWAESAWSLAVTLRMTVSLLGGTLIPLALFPAWSQPVLAWLPFPCIISFPARSLLGELDMAAWAGWAAVTLGWAGFFTVLAGLVWKAGSREYSAVGH
ncbi:MAG: family transporter protein [Cyanobacteria bacterium RYN_339]|nr:family transporter protein [Cyanobacteria bacterium RYN_339]